MPDGETIDKPAMKINKCISLSLFPHGIKALKIIINMKFKTKP